MYQFTREFIINDLAGKLGANKDQKVVWNADVETLMIDHMCNIRKKDVAHIYKNEGVAESIEKFTLDFSSVKNDLKKGEVIRLVMTLGQENRVHPLFNDNYPDHTQTFIYETEIKIDGEDPTAGLVAAMKAERNRFENLYFTIDDTNKVTLMDCYTRLVGLRLVKVPANHDNNANLAAQLTGYQDYEVIGTFNYKNRQEILAAKSTLGLTEGNAGVNTTNYIVQNMRLLTDANINPYGVNMDERPLPKSVYDQYTVEMVTERRHIGHQVMGAIDHSLVTIIFFVLNNGLDEDSNKNPSILFKKELEKIGTVEAAYKTLPKKQDSTNKVSDFASPVGNVIPTMAEFNANKASDNAVIEAVQAAHADTPSDEKIENLKKQK